ncbi:uncharacterized protein LOC126902883 [Daktulosphaira vitifoliae]|uniref:uncharacterized protein LOC126902883 n=1 Tax=Daktulosphaira vitifoliae TaxID=58002 RepID=UPI0021AAADD2|nr:uncharacterized protein LOC126902883 [Daktulosphaira vitifoliae]XP_050536515.1 uncharacterized protein LOC126902883 [Daktulosphaira vitifoliae]
MILFDTYLYERNNVKIKYKIQTATFDHTEEIIELMKKNFLNRETLTEYIDFIKDAEACEALEVLWKNIIRNGNVLIAVLINSLENGIKIIGVNLTNVVKKETKFEINSENKKYIQVLKILNSISNSGKLFDIYHVEAYLDAMGLCVHSDYHGYQIGYRLLESREKLCKSLGLSVTGTVFTSKISQHLALKLGFIVLSKIKCKDIDFGGLQCKCPDEDEEIKFMARQYT